ncbi:MAG: type II secretion system protein [bacterium]
MRQITDHKTSVQGFTLLEVLFAVAIIGISMVTLVGLEFKTIRLQQISNRITVAALLAEEKLNEKMAEISATPSPSLYNDEGDFEDDDEDFHWEYSLATTPAATLYRIDLTVYWDPENKEESSVTLSSFVAAGGP